MIRSAVDSDGRSRSGAEGPPALPVQAGPSRARAVAGFGLMPQGAPFGALPKMRTATSPQLAH